MRETKNELKNDLQRDLNHAAYVFWLSKRPKNWNEAQHLNDPAFGCITPAQAGLAEAVAEMVRARGVMVEGIRLKVDADLPENAVMFRPAEPAVKGDFFWEPNMATAEAQT